MMALLFDFKCSNGHTTESLVSSDTTAIRCSCGEEATKVISPVRSAIDPIRGDSWKATKKWATAREQKRQQERKANS